MSDDALQQRPDQIRAKIRRITGNKELSPKALQSLKALTQELCALEGDPEEIFKLFK
jgi:hypothetical protein